VITSCCPQQGGALIDQRVVGQMFNDPGGVSTLQVRLLGGFGIERSGPAGAVSSWQRRSAKTLTKLLAAHPRHALHREQILDILWPGIDTESALNSFGKAVHAARHAFEPDLPRRHSSTYLRLEDSMLALDMEHVAIDADQFEQVARDALRRRDVPVFESALAVYSGELLPEDRYADWCAERRNVLAELHVRVLLAFADELERRGAYNESADHLRQVLQKDQTREEVHRRLMRLYADMGTPDQAVRQFHRCESALRRELDLAPQHETVLLYHDILASRTPPHTTDRIEVRGRADGPGAPLAETAQDKPFIGREPVIRYLCQQLTRRDDRGAGMILINGEAGVGKTRLLEEFAAEAGRQGALALWGGSGAHAHQFAWIALEGYAASRPEAERDELARCYPPLARFVPSLRITSEFPASSAGPSDHQSDLIPAIVRLLTDLARKQSVLLVLGDLHEADPFSLDLLRYLAQLAVKRPWLMVGVVREEEVEAATELGWMIEATMRERLCLKIDLGCLSRADCDELVRAMLGGSKVAGELAGQIYDWSRGNPLFVEELVHQLRENAPGWDGWGESARVPARVRTLTAMRLARMDETLRRVLGLAAATHAAEISLSKLRTGAAALDPPISDAALLDVLDRALQIGLLEERTRGYAFRHPLIRAALYEGLARHRRDQLQAALAQC
jgi:DNA-binding SARP family transcriptional activator